MIAEGDVLNGRYRVDRLVGRGSFAQVFLSTDLILERKVALKILHPDLGGSTEEQDFLARFTHEARIIAALDHPNILGIYDYGQADGQTYLIMPYVEGGTLYQRLRECGYFSLQEANDYLQQAAAALNYAHRRQLVHRDIKPQNLLLRAEDGRLLLADFGIAKVLEGTTAESRTAVMGTLAYMAPEQLDGHVVPETDVYALGCVLFQMLTGQVPYTGSTQQVIMAHLMQPIPAVSERSQGRVPLVVQGVLDRALAKRPTERFQTAGALAEAFQAAITREVAAAPLVDVAPVLAPQSDPTPQHQGAVLEASPTIIGAKPPGTRRVVPPIAAGAVLGLMLVAAVVTGFVIASRRGTAPALGATATTGNSAIAGVASPTAIPSRVATLTPGGVPGVGTPPPALPIGAISPTRPIAASPDVGTPRSASPTVAARWEQFAALTEHAGYVTSVAWSPDGTTLASGSDDKTIRLWGAEGKSKATLVGHSERVRAVAWSPDGKLLASGAQDNTVRLWSADGREVATLRGHAGYVTSVAWSPDGTTLASGSDDGTLRLWDPTRKELRQAFAANAGYVISVAWSPDGKTVALGTENQTVQLWSPDGATPPPFLGHTGYVTSVAWSPDGTTIASGSDDRTVRLWSTDGREVAVFLGHIDKIWSVAWSPDGTTIASTSVDTTVRLWGADGKVLAMLMGHQLYVPSVAWSPDGKTLATASWDKTIRLWRVVGRAGMRDRRDIRAAIVHRQPTAPS